LEVASGKPQQGRGEKKRSKAGPVTGIKGQDWNGGAGGDEKREKKKKNERKKAKLSEAGEQFTGTETRLKKRKGRKDQESGGFFFFPQAPVPAAQGTRGKGWKKGVK